MLERISHEKLGLGVCLDEFKTVGGKQAVRVIFDTRPEEERILLAEFVRPSTALMPPAAAVAKKARTKKPKPERIKDTLLVETNDPYLPDDSEIRLESAEE